MGKCAANSKRSKQQCRNWAIRKRSTCRMHGGCSKAPKTKAGREQARSAVLKHGRYTKKAFATQREVMEFVRISKNALQL